MKPYTFGRWHRLAIVPTIADISAPTLDELAVATDIGDDVVINGLSLVRTTESVAAGLWHDRFQGTRPGRYTMDGAQLTGRRSQQGSSEQLWDLAVLGDHKYLVVRRGVPKDTAWSEGDKLEVFEVIFGKRSVRASADAAVLYDVPLHVVAEEDSAQIPGTEMMLTIDDEGGAPLDDEGGEDILDESSP